MSNNHGNNKNDIQNNGGEIWVHEFTEKSARKFRQEVMDAAASDQDRPIVINIDSYGGSVDALAAMIETIDEVRTTHKFITVCRGKAMSCGAILLAYGDIRYCGESSRTLIHNVSSWNAGDVYDQKAGSAETERLNKLFLGLLAKCCDMTYDELQAKVKASTNSKDLIMDAEESLQFGLVDQVGLPMLVSETVYQVITMMSVPPEKPEIVKPEEEPEPVTPPPKKTAKKTKAPAKKKKTATKQKPKSKK
jgi:ATP-dependent protease ClpP protease subunit